VHWASARLALASLLVLGVVPACKGKADEKGAPPPSSASSAPPKECDDYAAKMDACLAKLSPEERGEEEAALKATRASWAEQKDTAALAKNCKAAMAAMPTPCR
jgi:hypothetical protein